MSVFKKTNLYLEYEDNNKEFENTKGSLIVQNIEEKKTKQRSIDNSFNIEYVLNQFNADANLDKIKTKIVKFIFKSKISKKPKNNNLTRSEKS